MQRLPRLGCIVFAFGAGQAGVSAAPLATVERVGQEWEAYGCYITVFEVRNRSGETLEYSGYAKASPVLNVDYQRENHWLLGYRSGWCGVGLKSLSLAPEDSFRFSILPQGKDPWRVGLNLRPSVSVVFQTKIYSDTIEGELAPASPSSAGLPAPTVRLAMTHQAAALYPYEFTLTNTSASLLYYGGFREKTRPRSISARSISDPAGRKPAA